MPWQPVIMQQNKNKPSSAKHTSVAEVNHFGRFQHLMKPVVPYKLI
jgi:hypothetical protein